jgi:hypothetical protein
MLTDSIDARAMMARLVAGATHDLARGALAGVSDALRALDRGDVDSARDILHALQSELRQVTSAMRETIDTDTD